MDGQGEVIWCALVAAPASLLPVSNQLKVFVYNSWYKNTSVVSCTILQNKEFAGKFKFFFFIKSFSQVLHVLELSTSSFLYLQMEFDEKELRREISYAIKNIHGIRHV